MEGQYEPIAIEEVEEDILQGYSAVLGLLIRWERGQLRWHDPETGREIPTFEGERARADAAEEGRLAAEEARLAAEESRLAAEARVLELEAELVRKNEEA